MEVETKVTDSGLISKILFFGHAEYETEVGKFYQRLVKEIETQHKKKLFYIDGIDIDGDHGE